MLQDPAEASLVETTKKEYRTEDLGLSGNFQIFNNSEDEEFQVRWIKGLIEQIAFANRPEVLPDFVLYLRIRRRYEE